MASRLFSGGAAFLLRGNLSSNGLATGGQILKLMLMKSTYVFKVSETFVDNAKPDDLSNAALQELDCTGYQRGYAGSGRKPALLTPRLVVKNSTGSITWDLPGYVRTTDNKNLFSWSALGGAVSEQDKTNDTIGGAILIGESDNDAVSRLICFFDSKDIPTNGTDFGLIMAGTGDVQFV